MISQVFFVFHRKSVEKPVISQVFLVCCWTSLVFQWPHIFPTMSKSQASVKKPYVHGVRRLSKASRSTCGNLCPLHSVCRLSDSKCVRTYKPISFESREIDCNDLCKLKQIKRLIKFFGCIICQMLCRNQQKIESFMYWISSHKVFIQNKMRQ